MSRLIKALAVAALTLLAACTGEGLDKPPAPLGDFILGLNITVADFAQVPGISRKVTDAEWEEAMQKAMDDRFGRYTGNRIYNFGISIDGYVLAPPGVPLVASPKSALIMTVHVYEDAKQLELNPGGKRLTILESTSPETFVGSGWTQTKEQQMARLAYSGALAVQRYLLENPEWFGLPPKPEPKK